MSKVIKDPYMGWMYVGDNSIDIHGYGSGEICEAYITDTDISVWEMIHSLGGGEKFIQDAEIAYYEYRTSDWGR